MQIVKERVIDFSIDTRMIAGVLPAVNTFFKDVVF
jgi:hypothetical protein